MNEGYMVLLLPTYSDDSVKIWCGFALGFLRDWRQAKIYKSVEDAKALGPKVPVPVDIVKVRMVVGENVARHVPAKEAA